MLEADALLEAIWANPNDDTPRLVYADWLEENGYELYAQFIRLSCRIEREMQHPTDRSKLRLQRRLLGQEIVKAYPQVFPTTSSWSSGYNHGVASIWHTVDADEFLKNRQHWWPFIRPKSLNLLAATFHELEIANCDYLQRIEVLNCEASLEGPAYETGREEINWVAISGAFLNALADSTNLQRLSSLKIEPIQATAFELQRFAESRLVAQLEKLHLWIQFPDGSREDLFARKGFLKEQIIAFVSNNADQFTSS